MKELDDFDKLTTIFIYGNPENHEFEEQEVKSPRKSVILGRKKTGSSGAFDDGNKSGSDIGEQDKEMEEYINEDGERVWNTPSPTYKQGSIINR